MDDVAIIRNQANIGAPISPQEMERMAKRRFQDPKPQRRGAWWTMRVWRDEFVDGKHVRKQQRVRLAAATVPEREVKKIATEYLRPLNQGLESLGSATNFEHFIETIYKPVVKPLMATTSFDRTRGVLDNYLLPAFGKCCLRDLTTLTLQTYFSKLTTSTANHPLSHESRDKIRDVLHPYIAFIEDAINLAKGLASLPFGSSDLLNPDEAGTADSEGKESGPSEGTIDATAAE